MAGIKKGKSMEKRISAQIENITTTDPDDNGRIINIRRREPHQNLTGLVEEIERKLNQPPTSGARYNFSAEYSIGLSILARLTKLYEGMLFDGKIPFFLSLLQSQCHFPQYL